MVDSKKLIDALAGLHAVARVDRDEDYAAVTNAATVIAEAKATMCRFGQCSGSGWHEDNPVYGPCDCQRQEASELEQKAAESLMFLRNRLANDEPAWRALCDVMAGMLDPTPTRATAAPVVVGEDMVLIGWISGKPDENSGHLVFDKQTAHANVPVYTKGVRHV